LLGRIQLDVTIIDSNTYIVITIISSNYYNIK